MELFLDNDIILKLSAAGLLVKIEEVFDTDKSSIYVLPSARFYFKDNPRLKKIYSEQVLAHAKDATERYSIIPDEYNDDKKLRQLADIEKIDSGEQILFSLTPKRAEFRILTGDKHSIKALSRADGVEEIKTSLRNKIVFLEELILSLFKSLGFDLVFESVISADFSYDKVLKICFNKTKVNEKQVIDCLKSYINDLKRNCVNIFS